ncbi:hypothetical protein MFIFM68171_10493 [Madurella fahalii]|uniref:DUF3074 domain-containing protein n=1 Tax=Madurella fahalii TaxID=1157608 RepID=A0ABQ0GRC0_9PEZI
MSHYEPFKSLSALSWPADIAPHVDEPSSLTNLVTTTLANSQLLIDSIPTPTTSSAATAVGRARSHTDSSVNFTTSPPPTKQNDGQEKKERSETLQKLRRDWKDIKISPKDNPHGIAMYKLAAKDGKGAWFARRSLHKGVELRFEKWEAALRREMQETLARCKGKEAGTGNIRGIGAERRVERVETPEGILEVYQVSARFPGPTTPRDFVTLLMMPRPAEEKPGKPRQPRQFILVSRPCSHPDCPPRAGFIRGQYESVEVIREVPTEKPLRRTRSSIDLSRDDVEKLVDVAGDRTSKEAVLRAAKRALGDEAESEGEPDTKTSFSRSPTRSAGDGDGDVEMAVEWLMVTRSDPGGSVPRFMVEKGTPGGIVNDAGRFLKWLSSQTMEDLTAPSTEEIDKVETKPTGESPGTEQPGQLPANTSAEDQLPDGGPTHHEGQPPSSGLYGMLTSALGAASSAVASRVAAFAPAYVASDSDASSDESDTSSEASFESADEGTPEASLVSTSLKDGSAIDAASTQSIHSTLSESTPRSLSREPTSIARAHNMHEKELRKLQQRMNKAQEKLERAQARRQAKNGNKNHGTATDDETVKDKEKDDHALAKLREKHEREIAKQEEKYQRELKRLEEKRAAEERKAEERRRKAAEREERANVQMELERTRAERDLALKQVEMLKERVGELQTQNTMLVAKLGKEGVLKGVEKGEVKV